MITREDLVEQSIVDFTKANLAAKGYPPEMVRVRDAFPSPDERAAELTLTTVAMGFNFDDGGQYIEMGSDFTRRVYTIEMWVFGLNPEWGRNVAHVIRNILEGTNDGLIPLKDIRVDGNPVIDQLALADQQRVMVNRQIAQDPRPWDYYVWTVTARVEDFYYPSAWA